LLRAKSMGITFAKCADSQRPRSQATNVRRTVCCSTCTALGCIQASNIESYPTLPYLGKGGTRLSRRTLQHEVAALRGFLRFLATDGRAPTALISRSTRPGSIASNNYLAHCRGKRCAGFCDLLTGHRRWA